MRLREMLLLLVVAAAALVAQDRVVFKDDAAASDIGLLLAVDAELFRLDSVVRWLDAADARLKRAETAVPATEPTGPLPTLRRRVAARR